MYCAAFSTSIIPNQTQLALYKSFAKSWLIGLEDTLKQETIFTIDNYVTVLSSPECVSAIQSNQDLQVIFKRCINLLVDETKPITLTPLMRSFTPLLLHVKLTFNPDPPSSDID